MATVLTPFDIGSEQDEQQQKPNQAPTPSFNATPSTASGSGSVASPGASSGSPVQQGPKPSATPTGTSSGGFQNIQKYLDANKDFNSNQGGLAGSIANNVQGQANQANQSLQSAFSNFNNQANQATSNLNGYQDAVNNTVQNAGTANADQVNQLSGLVNAKYTGPTQIGQEDLSNLGTLQNNLQDTAKQTQSEAGRFNLLNQNFGNNGYTQGQKSLDNLFLQNNPQQTQQLKNLQNIANNFGQNVNNTTQQATNVGQANTQAEHNASQYTTNAVNNAINNTQNTLNTNLTNKNSANDAAYQSALQAINSGNLNTDLYNQLGLTSGQNLYGLTPAQISSYISESAPLNLQNVASQNDVNALNNLNGILGQNNTFVNASTATPGGPVNYNKTDLGSLLANQQAQYQSAYDNLNATQGLDQLGGMTFSTGDAKDVGYMNDALSQTNALRAQYGLGALAKNQGTGDAGQPVYLPGYHEVSADETTGNYSNWSPTTPVVTPMTNINNIIKPRVPTGPR